MPNDSRYPNLSSRILLVAVVLVVLSTVLVGARTGLARRVFAKASAHATEPVPASPTQRAAPAPTEQLEVELITVGPNGFEPAEIRRPAGPFILLIQNRSGTDLGPLRLEAEESGRPTPVSRIAEARINKQQQDYGERIELPVGRYRLRQTGNSGWGFKIVLMPR